MKRKFLAFSLCLALCLSSMLFFSACKEKPVPVGEVEAGQEFEAAMTNLESEEAIKMTLNMMGYEMIMISSEELNYVYAADYTQMWSVKNGDVYTEYLIMNVSYTDEPEYEYTKSIVPVEDEESSALEDILSGALDGDVADLSGMRFVSASKLNGVMSVRLAFSAMGEDLFECVFKIQNKKFTAMTIELMGMSLTYNLSYGANLLDEIPAIPTLDAEEQPIVWEEYNPYIVVEGLKDYYSLGETINLDDLTLKYYLDDESYIYTEYEVTMDMISGFSSSEVNSGTIVVTFCGFTFEQEYTCK